MGAAAVIKGGPVRRERRVATFAGALALFLLGISAGLHLSQPQGLVHHGRGLSSPRKLQGAQQPEAAAGLPDPDDLAESCLRHSSLLQLRPPLQPADSGSSRLNLVPFQVLSWHPRIVLFPNFVSAAAAAHIISLGDGRMAPSTVAYTKDEADPSGKIRTSSGAWLTGSDDPAGVLSWLEEKIAEVTMLPASHGQPFNLLRYEPGQLNAPHQDTFDPQKFGPQPSQRIATMVVYLSDVEQGGETIFKREGLAGLNRSISDWDSCDDAGAFKVRPRLGDALLFHNVLPDLAIDDQALHASCPVLRGTKWTLVRWLHERPWVDRPADGATVAGGVA